MSGLVHGAAAAASSKRDAWPNGTPRKTLTGGAWRIALATPTMGPDAIVAVGAQVALASAENVGSKSCIVDVVAVKNAAMWAYIICFISAM